MSESNEYRFGWGWYVSIFYRSGFFFSATQISATNFGEVHHLVVAKVQGLGSAGISLFLERTHFSVAESAPN